MMIMMMISVTRMKDILTSNTLVSLVGRQTKIAHDVRNCKSWRPRNASQTVH